MKSCTFFRSAVLPLVLLLVMVLFGCDDGGTTIVYPGSVLNTVWAGQTPAYNNTGWMTISFRERRTSGDNPETWSTGPFGDHVAVISHAHDSTSAVWDFSYDPATGEGKGFTNGHTNNGDTTNWNPGDFIVSADGKSITFPNMHGGINVQRLRQTDSTIDPVPFTPGDLAGDLAGSVWAGHTPAAGTWLTITFRPDNRVTMSFSHDNSSNDWEYTWDNADSSGTVITGGWPIAPNGFTIDGNVLSITNFGNHNPQAVHSFQRYR